MSKAFSKIWILVILVAFLVGGILAWQYLKAPEEPEPEKVVPAKKDLEVKDLDMLIFISPQYKNDSKIKTAINNYIAAVKKDINWNTKVIKITSENNHFKKIDNIIEDYYNSSLGNIKAVIMIGEDTHTALGGDHNGQELPSILPWTTIGRENAYKITGDKITDGQHLISVAVSLIYPTHDLSYEIKSSQIVSVFERFSKNRDKVYPQDIIAFYGGDVFPEMTREIFQKLSQSGKLELRENPTEIEVEESLNRSYKMYNVSGHGTPNLTHLVNSVFRAHYLENLDTPFFTAGGCFVAGWFSCGLYDNDKLDPGCGDYKQLLWYGGQIFANPNLRLLALGQPTQVDQGGAFGIFVGNFITNIAPGLTTEKTIAELIIGHQIMGDDIVFYGDPTFRYSNYDIEERSIIITTPNRGEKWKGGKTYNITWTFQGANIPNNVRINISLWKDNKFDKHIALGLSPLAGKYSWTIPTDTDIKTGSDYKIRIFAVGIAKSDKSDNYFSITAPPVEPKPDLIVTDISWSPAEPTIDYPGPVHIEIVIKNIGNADANNFKVDFRMSHITRVDDKWDRVGPFNLAVDKTTIVRISATIGPDADLREGYNTLTAKVDFENTVRESNENNNHRTETLIIRRPGEKKLP